MCVLIVLEGVTTADFENAFLNADPVLLGVSDRAAFFRRYYATNLDSYTSLIAMRSHRCRSPIVPMRRKPVRRRQSDSDSGHAPSEISGSSPCSVSTYAHQPFRADPK